MPPIQPPNPPPMRDPWTDPNQQKNASGINPSWYKWILQVFQTLIAQITAIQGVTIINVTQAQISGLGFTTADAGQLIHVTDYNHLLDWSGTQFGWGPGDGGSGYVEAFLVDPTGVGWHLCDGTAAVSYLKQDGTLGTVNLPDYSTASYLKLGTTLVAGPTAAGGVTGATNGGTPAGTIVVGNNDTNVEVAAGLGTFVAADPHAHPATFIGAALGTHTHSPGSIELQRTQLKGYFRR